VYDILPGRVEDAAVIFNMMVKDAAPALLAENEHGHLPAGGVDGRLQSGRAGSQNDNVVAFLLCHGSFSRIYAGIPPAGPGIAKCLEVRRKKYKARALFFNSTTGRPSDLTTVKSLR
jgi:hypothetical protein